MFGPEDFRLRGRPPESTCESSISDTPLACHRMRVMFFTNSNSLTPNLQPGFIIPGLKLFSIFWYITAKPQCICLRAELQSVYTQ